MPEVRSQVRSDSDNCLILKPTRGGRHPVLCFLHGWHEFARPKGEMGLGWKQSRGMVHLQ